MANNFSPRGRGYGPFFYLWWVPSCSGNHSFCQVLSVEGKSGPTARFSHRCLSSFSLLVFPSHSCDVSGALEWGIQMSHLVHDRAFFFLGTFPLDTEVTQQPCPRVLAALMFQASAGVKQPWVMSAKAVSQNKFFFMLLLVCICHSKTK